MGPPLVAFDFDGTLTDSEMIDELATEAGVREAVASVTEAAMRGELSYSSSLRERVDRLSGLEVGAFERAVGRIELRPGAAETIRTLRRQGTTVIILTGAFRRGVERVLQTEGVTVDAIVANELIIADGRLNGVVSGPLIEGTKDEALARFAEQLGCGLDAVVAVGDGANDVPMLEAAGTAIGIDPKPIAAAVCDHVVDDIAAVARIVGR